MAKKRRTELDIDSDFLAEKPEEAPPKEVAPPPPDKPAKEKHPKKKVNKVKLLIVAASGIAAVTLTVALVWLGASVFTSAPKHKPAPPPPPPPKEEAKPVPVVSAVYSLQPFFIPLKEKGATESKLVKIQFELEMVSPETQRDMDRNIILVRENIYFMLQNKVRADFLDKEKLAKLSVDVAIAVNRSLQSGGVSRVWITDILVS
jgi:flagellar basal body-associated protein FliL